MADEETKSNQPQDDNPKYDPGVMIGVEVSHHPVITFTQEEQNAIKDLTGVLGQRDMPAYREQIVRTWEKRLFDRGFQHLLPLRTGGWQIPQIGSGYGPGEADDRSIFETNIYNSYIQILVSALTREYPKPEFEGRDPEDGADITAASGADRIADYINRGTRIMTRQAELARFLCTDGQAVMFTRYMLDGQQYGYETQQEEDEDEKPAPLQEDGEVPEDEGKADAEDEGAGAGEEEPGTPATESAGGVSPEAEDKGETESTGKPLGRQVTTVLGALEVKLPIKAETLADCGYAMVRQEIDVSLAQAAYPDVAKDITPSSGGPGGDDIDRLARINVKLGIMDNFVTTDSQVYDVTKEITWMRPAQLLELKPPEVRDSIIKKCLPGGLRVVFCGQTFCEGRAISMDDQLSLIHALPGDGVHRPGFADWLMPIQKVINENMELIDDYGKRGVPNKYMDNEMFNVPALRKQTNVPGATHPFTREPNVTMDQVIWQEAALEWPEAMAEWTKFLILDLAQLLTGAVPALSGGGDASPTDTFGGMLVQRDQAIGRLGIPWRNMKEGMACSAAQSVRGFAHNNERAVKLTGSQSVTVEMEQLKNGNFLAYPVADENFPETPTQKSNVLAELIQDATANPLIGQLMDDPDNMEKVLKARGVDLSVPTIDARDKQLGEIDILLKSGPVPNPQLQEIQQQIAQIEQGMAEVMAAAVKAGQMPDPRVLDTGKAQMQQFQQQMQSLPQQVSTVQIGYFDDHATELATCVKLINSSRGRELRNGTDEEQQAFQNLELHGQEHEAALAKKQAGQPKGGKPPSVSIALKDLPPKEAAEAANLAGITASPQDFVAAEAADAAEKHPAPGGINITGTKPNGQQ